ncbi:MAG: polysaccharide biosynthesis/export family protein [Bacteroidales bacterium]|nr:polysaccharide biosynthesis/export family protein [Bacteroidales bacterium]
MLKLNKKRGYFSSINNRLLPVGIHFSQILIIFLFISLAFSSCKILNPNQMFKENSKNDFSGFESTPQEYILKPYDKLDVKVFSNKGERLVNVFGTDFNLQNASMEYKIEYDGMVKLPMLDTVHLEGLTIRQAEEKLEDAYHKYFQDPFIFIKVTNKRVIVFANGSAAGSVILMKEDNYTLVEAIAEAGGISDYSMSYKIKLIRGDLNNPQIFRFDLSKIEKMKDANFVLQANDIIYVDSRPRYSSRILQELTPYLSLVTTGLLLVNIFK